MIAVLLLFTAVVCTLGKTRLPLGVSSRRHIYFARVKILIAIALRMFSVPVLLGKNSPISPPVCPQRARAEEGKSCNFPTP